MRGILMQFADYAKTGKEEDSVVANFNQVVAEVYDDGSVALVVLDSGPGIRSADPNSLIKPFARENIARGTQLGAGLGLTLPVN